MVPNNFNNWQLNKFLLWQDFTEHQNLFTILYEYFLNQHFPFLIELVYMQPRYDCPHPI